VCCGKCDCVLCKSRSVCVGLTYCSDDADNPGCTCLLMAWPCAHNDTGIAAADGSYVVAGSKIHVNLANMLNPSAFSSVYGPYMNNSRMCQGRNTHVMGSTNCASWQHPPVGKHHLMTVRYIGRQVSGEGCATACNLPAECCSGSAGCLQFSARSSQLAVLSWRCSACGSQLAALSCGTQLLRSAASAQPGRSA
jgi:hypothetical protein